MVYNDYEGFSGGASATVTVKMDESGCSSGSSGSPSGSSGSPSGSSGSPSGSSHMGLLGLINTIIATFVLL